MHDYLIVGSNEPILFDYARIRNLLQKNQGLARDLRAHGIDHPFSLLATTFVLDDADVRAYASAAPLHVDNRITLEFSAPLFLFKNDDMDILAGLQRAKKNLLPDNMEGINPSPSEWALLYNLAGEAFMRLRDAENANTWFQKAYDAGIPNARTITNLARIANIRNEDLKAEALYKKAIDLDPGYALPYFHLGQLYVLQGLDDKGLIYLEKGMKQSPDDSRGALALGQLYYKKGRYHEARSLAERVLSSPRIADPFKQELEQLLAKIIERVKS
jgi:tetratricopeptide (TPR) repeat protein